MHEVVHKGEIQVRHPTNSTGGRGGRTGNDDCEHKDDNGCATRLDLLLRLLGREGARGGDRGAEDDEDMENVVGQLQLHAPWESRQPFQLVSARFSSFQLVSAGSAAPLGSASQRVPALDAVPSPSVRGNHRLGYVGCKVTAVALCSPTDRYVG